MSEGDEFVKEFLTESQEGLDRLERDLLALESNPNEMERLDSAFRVLHTIKGNAGFLDFPKLGNLAHAGESLLSRLRSGERRFDSSIFDVLLQLLDSVRRILRTIASTGTEGGASFDEVEGVLRQMASNETGVAVLPSSDREAALPEDKDPELGFQVTLDLSSNSVPLGASVASTPHEPEGSDSDRFPTDGSSKNNAGIEAKNAADKLRDQAGPPQTVHQNGRDSATRHGPAVPTETRGKQPLLQAAEHRMSEGNVLDAGPTISQSVENAAVGSASSSHIRVDVDLLDRLMNLVGELVLSRNQIMQIVTNSIDPELLNTTQRLSLLTTEIQEGVLKTRMQQIGSIWQRYPRMVRDFSKLCGKEVELQLTGADTELDKSLVESITDPLVHLIRNAIDHGIERPSIRRAKGKHPVGTLSLKASHEGGQVLIEITDDGSGLDLGRIRKKAIERGLFTESDAALVDEHDIRDSIFMPGFSTSDEISSVSGRGVGMDVVKTHIERVSGTIEIDSEKDVGTTFRLTVPLTLAIIPALIVTSGGQRFAIPQTNVAEMLTLQKESSQTIEYFHDMPVLRLRGDVLPIVSLTEQLQTGDYSDHPDSASVLVLKTGTRQYALIVDSIGDSEEIVVKPFGQVLGGMSEYGGATIMGDGSVALILDVRGVAQRAGLFSTERSLLQSATQTISRQHEVVVENALLVAELNGEERIGLPLNNVVRLEEIPADRIEVSEGREVVQYRGDILPIIRLSDMLRGHSTARDVLAQSDLYSVVICHCVGCVVGLIVDRVIDIAEDPEQMRPAREPGLIAGTVVSLDSVTDVIDTTRLLEKSGLSVPLT